MATISDQESHSIASLLSSSITFTPFSTLETQLKQAKSEANGDMPTETLLERTIRRLAAFEQDQDRMLPRLSDMPTLKKSVRVDPYKLVKAMLEWAPSEYGRRYVAAAICGCENTNTLVELSNMWLRYLLIPLAGNFGGADFQSSTDSESSTPTSDQEFEFDDILDPCIFGSTMVRLRDGYQCLVTELYHTTAAPPHTRKTPLTVTYIFKRAIGIFDPQKDKKSLATWEILRRYAGWGEKRTQDVIENLDTPINGMLVRYPYDLTWDYFAWTFKPVLNSDGTVLPSTYDIEVINQNDFPGDWAPKDGGAPINTRIVFKDRGTDSTVQEYMPKEDAEFLEQLRPIPDPELIALHRALSWVFNTSGAGEAIESVFRDLRGVKVPSKKIRNTDELDEILSKGLLSPENDLCALIDEL